MQTPSSDEQRNLIIAAVLSFAVILGWQALVVGPQVEERRQWEETQRQAQEQAQAEAEARGETIVAGAEPGLASSDPFAGGVLSRNAALEASGDRIQFSSGKVEGSLALAGGRIDELQLKDYRVSLEEESDLVELLWPARAANAYYSVFGWLGAGGVTTPGDGANWALAPGSPSELTPETPITLIWDSDSGLRFTRTIALDDAYLFTITQSVENRSEAQALLRPYGQILRYGTPESTGMWILHEGPIAVADGALDEIDYDDFEDADRLSPDRGRGVSYSVNDVGWLGFTDKYWMTALSPVADTGFEQTFEAGATPDGRPIYRAAIEWPAKTVAPGETFSVATRFFAGAKEISALRDYQYLFDGQTEPTGLPGKLSDFLFGDSPSRFTDAIDWGWFSFLTKPIFEILASLNTTTGNMGVAIILLTVLVKTLTFPLAYKSYVSMSKLKKLQPEVKKIQERAGDDKMKMQQEMMALYKREKANPAAGCLPILIQIPVFFALYKVLFVTIEMRHAPFFGWIQDLSARDPTTIFNGFGLIPWQPPDLLMIGVWPLIMGVSMYIQQKLNPQPPDPLQAKIFMALPVVFTVMLAQFPAGLVIYWTWNNILTILQQWVIMRKMGVKV